MKTTQHDAITGETMDRVMTAAEVIQFTADQASKAERQAEAAATAAAKAELLARLGITADEAKLLLGGN